LFLGVLGDLGGEIYLRLHYFAAAQAGGADAHAPGGGGAHAGVHRTQIDVPATLGDVVGVADAVSRLRLLAANFTLLSHDWYRFLSDDIW
jgi:hypothetical protein